MDEVLKPRFDFRTKTVIVSIILSLIISLFTFFTSINSLESFLFFGYAVFHFILYSVALFLFFKKGNLRKIAWIIVLIAALQVLFLPAASEYQQGPLISFFSSLFQGEAFIVLTSLMISLAPIVLVVCAITELMGYGDNKFDLMIGVIFSILICLKFMTGPIASLVSGAFAFENFIRPLLYCIVYVVSVVIWGKRN